MHTGIMNIPDCIVKCGNDAEKESLYDFFDSQQQVNCRYMTGNLSVLIKNKVYQGGDYSGVKDLPHFSFYFFKAVFMKEGELRVSCENYKESHNLCEWLENQGFNLGVPSHRDILLENHWELITIRNGEVGGEDCEQTYLTYKEFVAKFKDTPLSFKSTEKIPNNMDTKKTGKDNLPSKFVIPDAGNAALAISLLLVEREEICDSYYREPDSYFLAYDPTKEKHHKTVFGFGENVDHDFPTISLSDFLQYWTGEKQYVEPPKLPEVNGYQGKYLADQNIVKYSCAEISEGLIQDFVKFCHPKRIGNRQPIGVVLNSGVTLKLEDCRKILKVIG